MQKIQLVQTQDREVNQLQANIVKAVSPLLQNPALFGLLLTRQVLGAGANTVLHKLGRPLQGWVIVRQRSLASVYDTQDLQAEPETFLNLTASAPVTVDLYVF